jgi:tRNA-dihydrouridine synthase B
MSLPVSIATQQHSISTHQPLSLGLGAVTALAPMQDVTDIDFMNVIAEYGCPDYFFTEYFRVHETSRLDKPILRSLTENTTGKPIFAQMIGESIPDLVRIAKLLSDYPVAGIDLNMGCPAPRIYRKNVGGGLLRDPDKIDRILGELRANVSGRLTVKMRIGFEDTSEFDRVLSLIDKHDIDLLSLHGRTVKEAYHGTVHYDSIAQAVARLRCPVLANGNVSSVSTAMAVLSQTQAAGVMIGRSAIRNPWIFSQIREVLAGQAVTVVTLGQVREYIDRLYRMPTAQNVPEKSRVSRLKMYLNYIGQSVDGSGGFLSEMRRAKTEVELFDIIDRYLLTNPQAVFSPEPYPGIFARPKCED